MGVLGIAWSLELGVYSRAIIPAREKCDLRQRTECLRLPNGKRPACLKEMDIRGYFALRLPRGVTVAPEILDLFV
jgi:hypothetical protein